MIGTPLTNCGAGGMRKLLYRCGVDGCRLGKLQRTGMERSAIRTHQTGDFGADDIAANFPLEGAQHSIVVKGSALHDNVPAQFVGR